MSLITVSWLIEQVSKICEPHFKFEMDDIYGDRGGIPYPPIEELKLLYFKLDGKTRKNLISANKQMEILDQVNLFLQSHGIPNAELSKIQSIGKFIVVDLQDWHYFKKYVEW
jgi:hypothetical protein